MQKTNVMRILDQKKIAYQPHCYEDTGAVSGKAVAEVLGQDVSQVFKTLVTVGGTKKNYVFVIPVHKELDLKKAASAVQEKKIEMIKTKELLPLTGYVHGGCSPVGMKKSLPETPSSRICPVHSNSLVISAKLKSITFFKSSGDTST